MFEMLLVAKVVPFVYNFFHFDNYSTWWHLAVFQTVQTHAQYSLTHISIFSFIRNFKVPILLNRQLLYVNMGEDRGGLLLCVNMGEDRGGLLLCVNMGEDRGGLLLCVNMGEDRGGLLLCVNMGKIGVACYCVLTWGR